MRRLAISAGAVLLALMLQLTLVDRLPLPAGGTPDLVLLVVVALGLTGGPATGLVTGFCAGLVLDIAPPASQVVGEHALVFCLVGYGCGRFGGMTERSAVGSLGIAALAVAGGETLYVLVALTLGDPSVSWQAIRLVLPSSVLQDILVSPFAVYVVMRASSWAAARPEGSAAAAAASRPLPGQPAAGLGDAAAQPGRARSLSSLRFGRAAARPGDGWVGGGPRSRPPAGAQARPEPRLRFRGGAGRTGAAGAGAAGLAGSAAALRARQDRRPRFRPGPGVGGSATATSSLAGQGTTPRARRDRRPRFRPGAGIGGSAAATSGLAGQGTTPRARRDRGPRFRLGASAGGSASATGLAGSVTAVRARRDRRPKFRPGAGLGGSAATVQLRRRPPARPVSIRLAAGRRGSARRGGGAAGGGFLRAASGGATGRTGLLRQPRFRGGGSSLPAGRTRGGAPGRWRIGGRQRFGGGRFGGARFGGRQRLGRWRIGGQRIGRRQRFGGRIGRRQRFSGGRMGVRPGLSSRRGGGPS
jgi:rod shape-determining protein MreD